MPYVSKSLEVTLEGFSLIIIFPPHSEHFFPLSNHQTLFWCKVNSCGLLHYLPIAIDSKSFQAERVTFSASRRSRKADLKATAMISLLLPNEFCGNVHVLTSSSVFFVYVPLKLSRQQALTQQLDLWPPLCGDGFLTL